jgi:hypothetical protein
VTIPLLAKRWTDRAQRWIAPGALFDPRRCSVDVVDRQAISRPFIERHHYAGTFPAERLSIGLFGRRAELVGLAVFSVPASNASLAKWTGMGHDAACELGRFVCTPDVAYNGETWFLARATKLLASEKQIRAIVSFADPVEWRAGAEIVKPEHWGTIYQASNALHAGRCGPRSELVGVDGRPVSARALSKLRKMEKGWEYAARQLLTLGAPARAFAEHPRDWLRRVRCAPGFACVRRPGNLAYVFGLDDVARLQLKSLHRGGQPYPKRERAA